MTLMRNFCNFLYFIKIYLGKFCMQICHSDTHIIFKIILKK